MPESIMIPIPDNWHCHLREGPLLDFMVEQLDEGGFRGGHILVMPNTKNPILNSNDAIRYKHDINVAKLIYARNKLWTRILFSILVIDLWANGLLLRT